MFALTPFEKKANRLMTNDPFCDFFKSDFFAPAFNALEDMKTDVQDLGDHYLLEADLPGFEKKDISADIIDHRLIIKAERNSEKEEKDDKKNYVRKERSYGSFQRSFDLSDIKEDAITASYADGVLKITLPKEDNQKEESHSLIIE